MKLWKNPSTSVTSKSVATAAAASPAHAAVTVGSDAWRRSKEKAAAAAADGGTLLAQDDGKMDVTVTCAAPHWDYYSRQDDGSMQTLSCLLEKSSVPNTSGVAIHHATSISFLVLIVCVVVFLQFLWGKIEMANQSMYLQ